MKKLLVLTMVLVICSMASASLKISVDGVVDVPDTEILLDYSDMAVIDVYSDGQTPSNAGFFLVIEGPATVNLDRAINTVNPGAIFFWEGDPFDGAVFMDLAIVAYPIPPVPPGTVVNYIDLHCEGPGDVLLTLYGDYTAAGGVMEVLDTQIIHQIPEPMTIALLGLGGLFLRRRK